MLLSIRLDHGLGGSELEGVAVTLSGEGEKS